jgi:hypothetical protein
METDGRGRFTGAPSVADIFTTTAAYGGRSRRLSTLETVRGGEETAYAILFSIPPIGCRRLRCERFCDKQN